MNIIAFDVDLHKIYGVHSDGEIVCKASPDRKGLLDAMMFRWDAANFDIALVEVASPVMYIKDSGAVHNVVKWALWNITFAQELSSMLGDVVKVAPSHVWTKGHDLKMRHEIAGCKHKQKDLRECEAMIYYYTKSPDSWVTLPKYLENL